MFFFLLIVTLPILGALGHDIYLYTLDQGRGFEFSALGFIWTKYHPESYKALIDAIPQDYQELLNYILTYKAFYIGLAIAVFGYALAFIIHLISGSGKKHENAYSAAKKWQKKALKK
jgi:mannose/fructose/N-acetylgalactosamine-specific phosphotransferase system component IIC